MRFWHLSPHPFLTLCATDVQWVQITAILLVNFGMYQNSTVELDEVAVSIQQEVATYLTLPVTRYLPRPHANHAVVMRVLVSVCLSRTSTRRHRPCSSTYCHQRLHRCLGVHKLQPSLQDRHWWQTYVPCHRVVSVPSSILRLSCGVYSSSQVKNSSSSLHGQGTWLRKLDPSSVVLVVVGTLPPANPRGGTAMQCLDCVLC